MVAQLTLNQQEMDQNHCDPPNEKQWKEVNALLSINEIKTFIENDAASAQKRAAKIGQRYYESDHDIKNFRIFYVDADGTVKEDKQKSNIKISHPFFTEICDQTVQYMLSGDRAFRSDDPDLQSKLDEYFNDNEEFNAELYDVLTGSQAKGFEYMYAYKTQEGRTAFQCADSIGVIEVRAKECDDGCDYVIFWYVDHIGKNNQTIKRIQVWDDHQTAFFCQHDNGIIEPDGSVEINPRPHMIFTKDGDDSTRFYSGFGFIPFFRLDNGRKKVSALVPIKDLIDDYDLMSCGLSNNIQDTNEALYVVRGFQGDNLDELMFNIKSKKHIGVDEDGDVEIRTVDIPYQARQAKLELDEKNIYRFGMGFNSAQVGDGNITNIVIKSRYALLDLKCNKIEIRLKQFFRKLLKIVLQEINDECGADYQQKDVWFDLKREVMTNAQDNAQIELTDAQKQQVQINTMLNLQAMLDQETLLQQICDILDLDYNDLKDKLPDPAKADPQQDLLNARNNLAQGSEGDLIE